MIFQDEVILFQFECHLNVVSSEILIIVTIYLNGIAYFFVYHLKRYDQNAYSHVPYHELEMI